MNINVEKLQMLLNEACDLHEEDSCQLAIYKSGKLIADICAGQNVGQDTLFPVFSVGKGLVATLALKLYEEGKLDFDAPVSEYWKEFACNGKEDIKVWMIFSHRTGLHNMPVLESFEEQCDWQKMVQYMAESTPVNEPGTVCNYQGITFAWLAGEIIARAGGKSFNELFSEKISRPLGIENEFYFGTNADAEKRVILPAVNTYWDWADFRNVFVSNPAIRAACIPSANGYGTARAVAKIYAAISGNGVDGVKLLDDSTVKYATISRRAESDPLPDDIGAWAHFGLGYALMGYRHAPGEIFGHGGALGAEGFAIPELELAVGFTKNKLNTTHPIHPLRDRISKELNIKIRHW